MSIMEVGNGLAIHPTYMRHNVPIFFDDSYNLLEAPTKWMLKVSRVRSRSIETTRNYAHILARYLNWLDVSGYGSQAWQWVDEDIFDSYLLHLAQPSAEGTTLQHETLLYYACRIHDFYSWAQKEGYLHQLEIETEEITYRIDVNRSILSLHTPEIMQKKLRFNLPSGRPAQHQREMDKFVRENDYQTAVRSLNDVVYQIIAVIIRITGLRPKDLFQIPYRGKGPNIGFVPYDYDRLPDDIDESSIYFEFDSKGKRRSIKFPGKLWRAICEIYIPIRRERANLYYQRHGVSPSNSDLFLSKDGNKVNYGSLYYQFSKVPILAENSGTKFGAKRFTARMLRHTCATYFVYEALKLRGKLGSSFVYDAALDEELRHLLGHNDIKTTLEYYVHLVNRFVHDDLLQDLKRSQVDASLSAILEIHGA